MKLNGAKSKQFSERKRHTIRRTVGGGEGWGEAKLKGRLWIKEKRKRNVFKTKKKRSGRVGRLFFRLNKKEHWSTGAPGKKTEKNEEQISKAKEGRLTKSYWV